MIQLDVIQGDAPWHAARAKYPRTASLAPAIMGCSKKKTRSDAIKFLATGVEQEFSQWVQENLLNRGHLIEEFAKPLAEKIIGKKLYPVTAISDDEYLLASYDGLSADDEDAWECKSWNEKKAEYVRDRVIPSEDIWQVIQQLAIGAKRCLYMVTDGTEEKTVHCWLNRDQVGADIERLIAGWSQADKDAAAYIPPEVIPAVTAAPIMALPALTVQVSGSITITDNLTLFGEKLQSFIGGLNTTPEDDQGFADIESAVKVLQKAQDALEASEANALAQVSTVDEMRRTVKLYIEMARDTRLMLDKVVKQRKEQIKLEFIARANDAHRQHIEGLEAEIVPIRLSVVKPDFAGEAKNKRNIASLRDALETALAGAKIEADAAAQRVRINLATLNDLASDHRYLFNDLQTLMQKPCSDCMDAIKLRVIEYKQAETAKLQSERRRMQIEEEKKAEAKLQSELRAAVVEEEEARKRGAAGFAESDANRLAVNAAQAREAEKQPGEYIKQPFRDQLIAAIAFAYKVPERTAAEWLIKEFQQRAA